MRSRACSASPGRQNELVSIAIFEDRSSAPVFFLGRLQELNTVPAKLLESFLNVIAPEGQRLVFSDLIFLPWQREQHYARVGAWNCEFNPSLVAKGLVRHDLKPESLGVELERLLLIPNWDAHEFDTSNHRMVPQPDSGTRNYRVKSPRSFITIVVK